MENHRIYCYGRVSASDQNLDRQLIQFREYVSDERYIFTDKASGKNFERTAYNALIGTDRTAPQLHEGDLLIICSLDRLGRNYIEIRKQWEYITQTLGANIKVLDMPLLDTSIASDSLDKRFIADLVLQILSYTAEKERENINKRQRQGIDAMREINGKKISSKTGRQTGRPMVEYPETWTAIYSDWKDGNITATAAMNLLGIKRTTFYKLVNQYEDNEK